MAHDKSKYLDLNISCGTIDMVEVNVKLHTGLVLHGAPHCSTLTNSLLKLLHLAWGIVASQGSESRGPEELRVVLCMTDISMVLTSQQNEPKHHKHMDLLQCLTMEVGQQYNTVVDKNIAS